VSFAVSGFGAPAGCEVVAGEAAVSTDVTVRISSYVQSFVRLGNAH
jgi:hypothetical protein